jgi:hypothetical protein
MSAFTPSLPAVTGSTPAGVGTLQPAPGSEGTLGALANQLGLDADSLQTALKQGQSIAGVAEQQGVPREQVAQFLGGQIQQARSYSGQPPLDQGALDRMVDRALDRGRPANSGTGSRAEATDPEAAGVGAYANNGRVTSGGVLPGRTISLLA